MVLKKRKYMDQEYHNLTGVNDENDPFNGIEPVRLLLDKSL